MTQLCSECGAPLAANQSCRDLFHNLLLLESEIPGGPTALGHFFAVATYGLQHPRGMNYTLEAITGLHQAVHDVLTQRATLKQIRQRTREAANHARRITRRPTDPPFKWYAGPWPLSVAHVLTIEPIQSAYAERVTSWARSVSQTLREPQA